MGGLQKSKRVSWASDVNLSQVRLFSSEETPLKVGRGSQDHHQANALRPVRPGGDCPDDDMPPGFKAIQPANLWRVKLSQIPLTKWRCPPKCEVNNQWQVVAGEESKEMEAQNQREIRVLEAIYPRPSAIPPNPPASVDVEASIANDQNIPVVPLTPIEDSDAVEPDIVAAALTWVISNCTNSDHGNLIDRDLLISILSNPKMVEQLITSHTASSCAKNEPSYDIRSAPAIVPPRKNTSSSAQITISECNAPSMAKDINYYKSLIQQYGGGGGETQNVLPQSAHQFNFMKSKESRSSRMIMKPCNYFNSSKGCRNGDNCAYQHDIMLGKRRFDGISEVQSVRRVKQDRGIAGA